MHRGCAGVLVLAATNRPQAIDAALLRPGRFDALLFVGPPDLAGRLETLGIHTRSIPLAPDVDLQARPHHTPRHSGALSAWGSLWHHLLDDATPTA